MKTVFVGAGRGARAVLEMLDRGKLRSLSPEVLAVVDIDPDAPAMRLARQRGWPTYSRLEDALGLAGLQLVVELTGSDAVLDRINRALRPGVRVLDHAMAGVFWDLEQATESLGNELQEQRRLRARLTAERSALQEILDTVPDAVMVVDEDLTVLRVNQRFEQLTGKRREQTVGSSCREVNGECVGVCGAFTSLEPLAGVFESAQPISVVQHHTRGDRETAFQVTAHPIVDATGKVVRVVRTAREITEQVRLKQETEQWALRFRQIVNAVHESITIKDLAGRYQLANPWSEQLLGVSEAQMVGHTARELFPAPVADLMESGDQRALDTNDHYASEQELFSDGQRRILVSERFPLQDDQGRVASICCVSRDETRARELQQELIQTERLSAVGKLAAEIAHELNNPLTGILTFAEDLLEQADADDPARPDYELIVNETLRCRRIVRGLLDYSRRRAPERHLGQLEPVVHRALAMVRRQASFHNIQLRVEIEAALPPVNLDPSALQQAILNLVLNARDAIEAQGQITVRAATATDRRAVVLAIEDTGRGIPEAELERIFEPFFSTKGDRGNGLGLPVVQSVVEQHGGSIAVESQVGTGTTFRISLPTAGD